MFVAGNHWSKARDESTVAGRLLEGIQILYTPDTPTVKRVIDEVREYHIQKATCQVKSVPGTLLVSYLEVLH